MDPEIICAELHLNAKHKWKSGEPRKTPAGDLLKGTYPETYCSFKLSHEPQVELIDLIAGMNAKLRTHKEFLESVCASGGQLEYFIAMYFNECAGDVFDYQVLGEMADLKINLALDLYGAKED